MRKSRLLSYVSIILVLTLTQSFVYSQGVGIPIECGSSIQADFVSNPPRSSRPGELYNIELQSGDRLEITLTPLTDLTAVSMAIFDPDDARLYGSNISAHLKGQPDIYNDLIAPSPGMYTIAAYADIKSPYTLTVGCQLRDGTLILPEGDVIPPDTNNSSSFSGFGFPGLAPVDMGDVARIPMTAGIPFTGAVTPAGSEILGYTFVATTDQRVNLNVERLSGNLNLGVVVIDADSNIIYFSALVTSETMSTRIRMPADGEYMVSVFRLDLLLPDVPDATAFSVQVDMVE